MSMREFVTADLHLEHLNIVTAFKSEIDPNKKARPWYLLDDMHDELTYNWNQVVRPQDKTFILGDLAFGKKGLDVLARMNGRKVLVAGNHDDMLTQDYLQYVERVCGCYIWNRILLSHMPVHTSQLRAHGGRYRFNIHGHLHESQVMDGLIVDPNYACVSVERHAYAPVELSSVEAMLVARRPSDGM